MTMLMPFWKVEVAPVTLSAVVWRPAPKVEVACPRIVVVAKPFDTEKTEDDALPKEASPVNHELPETESTEVEAFPTLRSLLKVEEAPEKTFPPEKMLESPRRVELAAVMV